MSVATQESQGGMIFKDNDLKIKIQVHRRANDESKEFPRTQGYKFKEGFILNDHPLGRDFPPPMTRNYLPSGPDVEIDYSEFTYGPKQTLVDELDAKTCDYTSCESYSSVETTTSMLAPVENAPKNDPHKALKDKRIVDSGCSRYITRNKAHLADYQEFKGGSVAFGDKGWLDFNDVYYVEELKHNNLFSVSQMCDKKNKVLFTDTDCLVLSLDFKLPDDNQVLLKIPRQHNMYSFNLNNIDPSGDLACLFAKASIDKSNK
nr:ribonuclease H-like domain-containing protein [Tanacetum cinerariifolium]